MSLSLPCCAPISEARGLERRLSNLGGGIDTDSTTSIVLQALWN